MSPEQLIHGTAQRLDLRAPQSSDFLSYTAHKPCGAMTLALCSVAPNTSRTFRSEQLVVCIVSGVSVRMDWCSADCRKVHSTILRPGQAEIMPAHKTIWQRCHEPAEFLVIGMDIQFVNGVAQRAMNRGSDVEFRHQSGIDDPKIKAFGTLFERELSDQGKDRELYSNSLADALALHLVERYGTVNDRSMGTLSPSRVKAVLGYINDHLADDLSVRMLADVVHMSPYHFARCFKQTVGIAPHRYVLRRRVECAKTLLANAGRPIADVAYSVGFSSQSHMTTTFRQFVGVTPKAFQTSI